MTVTVPPAFTHLGGRNKPRIYIAYYTRGKSKDGVPFHVAIIARPHPLDHDGKTSLRLHAVNTIVPPGSSRNTSTEAQVVWMHEKKYEKFFGHQIAGLMYLGKLPANKTLPELEATCARVLVQQDGADGWRCTNWLWGALEVCDTPWLRAGMRC